MSNTGLVDKFTEFMGNPTAWEMFIVGSAGTGKTTSLVTLLVHLSTTTPKASVVVCAYTHKACSVLRSVISSVPHLANVKVTTLHAYLKKRPTIDNIATKAKDISVISQWGTPETPTVLFVDEYSMVGASDYDSIVNAQDGDYTSVPKVKVVYVGDKYQLPPINDKPMPTPPQNKCAYVHELTTVYRQASDNSLVVPIKQVISFLAGAPATELAPSKNFIRGVSLVTAHRDLISKGKTDIIVLAYTNKKVQELNAQIQGYSEPKVSDMLYMSDTRQSYYLARVIPTQNVSCIDIVRSGVMGLHTKYRTLEHLIVMANSFPIQFMELTVANSDYTESLTLAEPVTYAVVFGHGNYKLLYNKLAAAAADINKEILQEHGVTGKQYATLYPHRPQSRQRSKAWRDFLTFKECVVCIDFVHATTIHKAQGATYEYVLLDTQDLAPCLDRDYKIYLSLMYVALSRASHTVITT